MRNDAPEIRVLTAMRAKRDVSLTRPFKFGDVVVTETQEAFCKVEIETANGVFVGKSAQLMVPRWFDKRQDQTSAQTVATLARSVELACAGVANMKGSVAQVCHDLRGDLRAKMPLGTPFLAAEFGSALVEMALIDALCLAYGVRFYEAAHDDLFGLATVGVPRIESEAAQAALSRIKPRWSVDLRHTVGYLDALSKEEANTRPREENAVPLDAILEQTGVRYLKIKLSGDVAKDVARLGEMERYFADTQRRATLDANEQYTPEAFADFVTQLKTAPKLTRLHDALLYIEQPFARERLLNIDVASCEFGVPLMIDEADDRDDSFSDAWDRGWQGTSIKSCKGVLRALANFCLVEQLNKDGGGAFLSGEDLTCQPGLALQQDTLMAAAVGITHAERNGHHFAGGMQGATQEEIARVVSSHPDMYALSGTRPELNIRNGKLEFSSLNSAGFGDSQAIDVMS